MFKFGGYYDNLKHSLLSLLLFIGLSVTCSSQTVTNEGTDFWIAFPPNQSTTAIIELYIGSNYSTNGQIQSAYPGVDQLFTVVPGIVTEIALPSTITLTGGTENKGIHITSNDPVAVYCLNNQTASTDAYLALPVVALGMDYTVVTYKVSFGPSCLSVVSTKDGTNVSVFNHQTNSTTNIVLNLGQTYHVMAPGVNQDLTGSRVQSDFPVAVFGSVNCANVPSNCGACDHVVEQMFPHYSWGKNYVTVPLAGRDASGDIFRMVAAEDATDININGVVASTINTGEYYETILTGFNSITSSKAFLLAQFAKGSTCSGNTGDPFMMLIPPKEQFLTHYTVCNVMGVTPFNSHWINVVAPDYALGTIYQDGTLIPNAAFTQIGSTNYYGAQRSVTQGSHTLFSTFPFGVFVYGWRMVDSYGYPGGGSLSPVGTVSSVLLAPDTSYGQLNVTTVCLTATVKDNLANPVVGVLVNFYVSGINPFVGNGYTDAAGHAQYCYTQTGVTPGNDHIYAEVFGFKSDTSVVIWSYAPPCTNPTSGGTIGNDQSGCGSYTPITLSNTALPAGQTGTLEYKWQQSILNASSGFTDIAASNSPGYSPGLITQNTWYKRVVRVDCMPNWSGAFESNVVEMTVNNPLPVSVSISASANSVCTGTLVTFTATPTNGGTNPSYQWIVNGINSGTDSPTYNYTPLNNDIVTCTLTSNVTCATGNPATSNVITMTVNPILSVNINIASSANPVCSGIAVTYTATPNNAGGSPVYQWKVNGVNTGTNSTTYTYNPVAGDQVLCTLNSSIACPIGNPATSNTITMNVGPVPIVTFTTCFDTVTTLNAKPIKLKGGIPLNGTYSGPGVSANIFNPTTAGIGTKTITYTYTNAALCSASATVTIVTRNPSPFMCGNNLTDIRDNKIYPTVQIGSQCWMSANLDFGLQISDLIQQRDNCIPEKYIRNASPVTSYAYYQWDEIMRYDDTPAQQGLCPAAWHVPTEAEWNTLFAFYTNNGFAGSPLKYSGFSGFNALLSGVNHLNRQWDLNNFATFFWSSTPYGNYKAWTHGMNDFNPSVSFYPSSRSNAFSVRCLKDN